MKRFVISVLSIAVFFVGLGTLCDQVAAKFKSDDKALEIVRKARTALGGDAALAEVRSMTIAGRTVNSFKVNGAERSEQGETEIALQFPDKLVKKIKIGNDDGTGVKRMSMQHEVVMVGKGDGDKVTMTGEDGEFNTADGKKIIIRHSDDPAAAGDDVHKIIVRKSANGETVVTGEGPGEPGMEKHVMMRHGGPEGVSGMKHNELLRLSLALLLTAPDGIEVNYTFAGESDVDGTAVNIINAEFGGTSYKLFIGKSSNLPVGMSYVGAEMPQIVTFKREAAPAGADPAKGDVIFTKKTGPNAPSAEAFVRFDDYRSTGGIQLPYKWTTTVGGAPGETFDVTAYEVNPVNIAEKFADQKVFVRTAKPPQK